MTENLRESFRIDAESDLEAELFHQGRAKPCTLHNLSAGGAKATSALHVPEGAACTLRIRLGVGLRDPGPPPPFVDFPVSVIELTPSDDLWDYRLRSTTQPGSPAYEAVAKLVFAAQRAQRATETGREVASPMAVDLERRRRFRIPSTKRFTKKSFRPGSHD